MFQKTGEKQIADKDSGRAFFSFLLFFFLAKMVFSKDKEIRGGEEILWMEKCKNKHLKKFVETLDRQPEMRHG